MDEAYIEQAKQRQKEGGRKGGKSRNATKRASSAANLAVARLKRWPGREAAKLPSQAAAAAQPAQPLEPNRADACQSESERNIAEGDRLATAGDVEGAAEQYALAQHACS